MAFLNVKKVKRMAQAASTAAHPLLSETTLDGATRMAYVQGCTLATLIDDEKVSDKERELVRQIGLSLRMQDAEIDECFEIVCGLSGDDQKNQFVTEILDLLKPEPVGRYFIGDFEKILASNGEIAGDSLELLDSFGAMLFADDNWRQKKEAVEEEKRKAAQMKADAEKAKQKAAEAAAKEIAKQERIAAKNLAFYEKMRTFVSDYVDTKRVTRDILLDIGDELSDSSFSDVDKQVVFREIAAQWLKRVEALDLPELTDRMGLYSSLRKKAGGELTQKERERFEQVRQIARETLWMVICLGILKTDAQELPVEKWPVGKINKIIGHISYRDFPYDNDVVSMFWHGRGRNFGVGAESVEELFKELLGVKGVWRSLFSLTDAQKKKLSSWMERRSSFNLVSLEEYARSIGVSRYCDGLTVDKLVRGNGSKDGNSSTNGEPNVAAVSLRSKALPSKKGNGAVDTVRWARGQGSVQFVSVWLKKIPKELGEISGEVLYSYCGGPKRFFCEKLGVLCDNINKELAFKIKGEIEKAGGEVEIRPS